MQLKNSLCPLCLRGTQTARFTLDAPYVKSLHTKMFDHTWKWVGQFRHSEKNIGVDIYKISYEIEYLLQDVLYQLEHSVYPMGELVARFHHRLVSLHCFPNGNGLHARLMAALFLMKKRHKRFSWGEGYPKVIKTGR